MKKITLEKLRAMKTEGEKIACLTAYDASFARLLDECGVDVILVGDSLGMVLHGHDNTLKVTVSDMAYHTALVSRGAQSALVIGDMPFMSYSTPSQALGNAARLMAEGGAEVVKIEGGKHAVNIVEHLSGHDVPVCGHVGLQPQSVHKLGGYRVQGREKSEAQRILNEARALERAGAALIVLECIPSDLAAQISEAVGVPTIGIGAGPGCDGQVLVLYDLIGVTPRAPRAARDFLAGGGSIRDAVTEYVKSVKSGAFPGPEQSYD